jgi:ribosomal-protein-alanine N-acetyltransferase
MTELQQASIAHGAVMAALHASAFPLGARWGADTMALQLGLPGGFGFVAVPDDGIPAGFVLARVVADEAEILTIAVHPARRRRGLAGLLLQAAESHAAGQGTLHVFLEVAESNLAARSLYDGRGYRQVGLRRGYYGPGRDALVLRSTLSPAAATAR